MLCTHVCVCVYCLCVFVYTLFSLNVVLRWCLIFYKISAYWFNNYVTLWSGGGRVAQPRTATPPPPTPGGVLSINGRRDVPPLMVTFSGYFSGTDAYFCGFLLEPVHPLAYICTLRVNNYITSDKFIWQDSALPG